MRRLKRLRRTNENNTNTTLNLSNTNDKCIKSIMEGEMKETIVTYLPYFLSANTIYAMLLAGNKKKNAWAFGLVGQLAWLIWILLSESWGLLPMNIALWVVYGRNYVKWRGK